MMNSPDRHCEERKRRSNPDLSAQKLLDCFASLATTENKRTGEFGSARCAACPQQP
jgi:hypothetical protein